jgi:hypothetical protein
VDDLTEESGGMLVSRAESRFDFGGARFRLPRDQALLGWIFDQFLYGEVTGIQCGHWLYHAPTLQAASFFARQAVEELNHVRQFLRLYDLIGARPGPAHPVVRFLATGAMGQDYAEHVATEMAVGEGLVLTIFYALIDTIEDPRVAKILEAASRQEERHVAFGEHQTRAVLARRPALAAPLLGLNLVTVFGVQRLAAFIGSRLPQDHEVLRQTPAFLRHLLCNLELRLQRMGLLQGALEDLHLSRRVWLMARGQAYHLLARLRPGRPRLTRTYLAELAAPRPRA